MYEDGDEEDLESGEVASLARSACTPLDSSQRGKDLIGCSLWAPPSKEGAGFVYVRVDDYDGLQYLVEYLHKDVADGVLGNETWDDADFRGCLIFPSRMKRAWCQTLAYPAGHLRQRGTGKRRTRKAPAIDVALAINQHVDVFMGRLDKVLTGDEDQPEMLRQVSRLLQRHARRPFQDAKAAQAETASMRLRDRRRQLIAANGVGGVGDVGQRTAFFDWIGSGFNHGVSGTTLKRHLLEWQRSIEAKYPENTYCCVEVAAGLAERFGVLENRINLADYSFDGEPLDKKTLEGCLAICESMRMWSAMINDQFKGRFCNSARSIYVAAAQAASLDTSTYDDGGLLMIGNTSVGLARRSAIIGISEKVLGNARSLWEGSMEAYTTEGGEEHKRLRLGSIDDLLTLRGRTRSDKHPALWRDFIIATWFDPRVTRRSEKARDQLRDRGINGTSSTLTVPKFFVETRQHVAIKTILGICKAHFEQCAEPPVDQHGQVKVFDVSGNYVRLLRPYNVIQSFGKRDTSLCRYHMSFEFIYGAIWKWQKTLRDKGYVDASVGPMIAYGAYEFRRQLVCHPGYQKDDDGSDMTDGYGAKVRARYDLPDCKAGTCEKCKELRLLVGHGDTPGLLSKEELAVNHQVDWQQWTKYVCPVTDVLRTDFRNTRTGIDGLLGELKKTLTWKAVDAATGKKPTLWTEFLEHHDLMKYMEDNKAHIRRHFPRGHVHVIEDFSENGDFIVRREHQSRYYQTHSYTLFGVIIECHVEDIKDELIPAAERARLIAMLERERPGEPHILTFVHGVLSEDTHHDPAAVMHFNTEVVFPWLKNYIHGFEEGRGVMHYTTDGAPTQFDCKDIYYWISRSYRLYKIIVDWVIGCAAHNKDVADGEMGHMKNSVNAVNLEYDHTGKDPTRSTQIQTVPEVKVHLETNHLLQRDIYQKKGVGIYAREIHHVKLGAINRRVPTVEPLSGSKKLHQFLTMGSEDGQLLVRRRPCHICPGCLAGDHLKIINECKFNDVCGQAYHATLTGTCPAVVLTGEDSGVMGQQLVDDAEVGDFLAVEVKGHTLPWIVGEVVASGGGDGAVCYSWSKATETDEDTGIKVQRGDHVVGLRLWMPLDNGGGSSTYKLTDKTVPVHPRRVRFKLAAADANRGGQFKVRRHPGPVLCRAGHGLVQNHDVSERNNACCNVCNAKPSPWMCPVAEDTNDPCDYDLCTDCKDLMGNIRTMKADTKSAIFNSMPNVGGISDPFDGKEYGGVWHKLYKVTDSSKNIQAIAIELRVSQLELVNHNGFEGRELHAGSRFRKGTTLWCPGGGDNSDKCKEVGCCA